MTGVPGLDRPLGARAVVVEPRILTPDDLVVHGQREMPSGLVLPEREIIVATKIQPSPVAQAEGYLQDCTIHRGFDRAYYDVLDYADQKIVQTLPTFRMELTISQMTFNTDLTEILRSGRLLRVYIEKA